MSLYDQAFVNVFIMLPHLLRSYDKRNDTYRIVHSMHASYEEVTMTTFDLQNTCCHWLNSPVGIRTCSPLTCVFCRFGSIFDCLFFLFTFNPLIMTVKFLQNHCTYILGMRYFSCIKFSNMKIESNEIWGIFLAIIKAVICSIINQDVYLVNIDINCLKFVCYQIMLDSFFSLHRLLMLFRIWSRATFIPVLPLWTLMTSYMLMIGKLILPQRDLLLVQYRTIVPNR